MFRQASLYITSLAPRNLLLKLHYQTIGLKRHQIQAIISANFSASVASLTNHNLYTYTSGRFILNESQCLHERYVEFNPYALL